jgi:glycosyltransferase involved in cell wall biosynthesis
MMPLESILQSGMSARPFCGASNGADTQQSRPFVSLVVPAYNEAPIIEKNLAILCQYMESLEDEYSWEMLIINDGSADETGALAESFASTRKNVHVLHHITNFGLGQALKFAFKHCRGDYIVTLDLDLSYAPEHIEQLLTKIRATKAKIVVTSPYAPEGKISNVPWLRRTLSIWANRFLSRAAKGHLSTLTSMVRAYDGRFIRSLNLKSMGMEINAETIHKALLLQARIEEIPAHLRWQPQRGASRKRSSSMKVFRHTLSVLLSGFLFRPVMFFIAPGLALLLVSLYSNFWMVVHVVERFLASNALPIFPERIDGAVGAAFSEAPHAFIVGGITLMLAIQLISLGILALQSKSYFEEIFHLGTAIYRLNRDHDNGKDNL